MKSLLTIILVAHAAVLQSAPVTVTIDPQMGMIREGRPYLVRGAGGDTRLEDLAARGANSIRTWSTDGLAKILDEAHALGLTVSAGIWLESECSWFSYRNAEHCAKQQERVRQQVLSFRDHPALLAWGLGNEAEGDGTLDAYWQQLDRLAQMVKEIDADHPTFTAVAGLSAEKARGLNAYSPHLDYVGVNTYGALFSLREHLKKIGWKRPWLVTEWGPQGFWERPKSPAGAPLEQTSHEKAAMIRRGAKELLRAEEGCLGSYVFLWGWKFEATATWFGLLTHTGETTEVVDVLQEAWSGRRPENRAPQIEPMRGVPMEALQPGARFEAHAAAMDPDEEALVWTWAVLPEQTRHEAGRRPKMPKAVEGVISAITADRVRVTAPSRPGVYRLHVWIRDAHGHAATANAPFAVQ